MTHAERTRRKALARTLKAHAHIRTHTRARQRVHALVLHLAERRLNIKERCEEMFLRE